MLFIVAIHGMLFIVEIHVMMFIVEIHVTVNSIKQLCFAKKCVCGEGKNKRFFGLQEKCSIILFEFSKIWIFLTYFYKRLQYTISRKFLTEGVFMIHGDKRTDVLTFVT
jgi:hypothetical protein